MTRSLENQAFVGEQTHRLADCLARVTRISPDVGNGRQRIAGPKDPVDDLLP